MKKRKPGQPKKPASKKAKIVSVRLYDDEAKKVARVAKLNKSSKGDAIRTMITAFNESNAITTEPIHVTFKETE